MIKLSDISKIYKSGRYVTARALDGVSLEFEEKGLVFIVGRSGCGKTTLLNILGGIDSPTGGEMVVDGVSFKDYTEKDLDTYRNKHVGYVFQEYNLLGNYTVGKNVSLALEMQGQRPKREQIEAILRRVELTDADGGTLYDRKITELSGGQKQRVAIARALIKEPDVILADEPTGALDSKTGEQLYLLLKDLSREKLIIVVSHDEPSSRKYGDRIIRMLDGKVIDDTCPYTSAAHGESAQEKSVQEGSIQEGSMQGETISTQEGAEAVQEGAEAAPEGAEAVREGPGAAQFAAVKPVKEKCKGLLWSRCLAMGVAGLKHKTVRLVISIILAVVFLTILGFAAVMATSDPIEAELRQGYATGEKTAVLEPATKAYRYEYGDRVSTTTYGLSDEQEEVLSQYMPIHKVLEGMSISAYYTQAGSLSFDDKMYPYNYLGLQGIGHFIELDPSTGEEDAYLAPVTADSRLPQSYDEIAITDFLADMFMKFGYTDMDTLSGTYDISSPEDLIGRTICGLEIVGVFSTEEDLQACKDRYTMYQSSEMERVLAATSGTSWFYANSYGTEATYWMEGWHMMTSAFVLTGFGETDIGESISYDMGKVLFIMTGKVSRDMKILKALTYSTGEEDTPTDTYADIWTTYGQNVAEARDMLQDEAIIAAYIICAVCAVISILLAVNFILGSMNAREREIGILRALGAKQSDVSRICLCEGGIIALIELVLSIIVVGILCAVYNSRYYISMFIPGILPILALVLVCFGTVAIATLICVLRLARKKPVDVINGAGD